MIKEKRKFFQPPLLIRLDQATEIERSTVSPFTAPTSSKRINFYTIFLSPPPLHSANTFANNFSLPPSLHSPRSRNFVIRIYANIFKLEVVSNSTILGRRVSDLKDRHGRRRKPLPMLRGTNRTKWL